MKRLIAGILLAAAFTGAGAGAEESILHIEDGALTRREGGILLTALRRRFPEAQWRIEYGEDGRSLGERIMADETPELAICSAQEAAQWAADGLLLPIEGPIPGIEEIPERVVEACMSEGRAMIAPLRARQRTMAVNRRILRELGLEEYLSERMYPTWQMREMNAILETCAQDGTVGMEIWPIRMEESRGLEGLVRSIACAPFVTGEEEPTDGWGMENALMWLSAMTQNGWIGRAESREEALRRFLDGETALFPDWTEKTRRESEKALSGIELMTMPYPSSGGVVTRTFDVVGVCAFRTGDEERDARAREAIDAIREAAMWGAFSGEIRKDGAVWLSCYDAEERIRLCEAMREALEEGESP